MKLLKLFASYYKPYKGLFALDMTAAAIASLLSVVFPSLTRYLLNTVIPQSDYRLMMIIFLVMLLVYLVQFGYIVGIPHGRTVGFGCTLFGYLVQPFLLFLQRALAVPA